VDVSAAAPEAPTSLTALPASAKGVQLLWAPPANTTAAAITSYKIYRSTTSPTSVEFLAQVNATATSYTDTTATSGASYSYYYTVTAVNPAAESEPSTTAGPVKAT
jgi:fibronectin type 3 domain-containing protein